MQLSVVAPCMNEEEGLIAFYQRMKNAIQLSQLASYEIIFIDDGSSDNTWEVIKSLKAQNPSVKGLRLSRNFGHQAALAAGLKFAQGEYTFIIDSDLQDPPELLVSMLNKMREGFDVVYGERRTRKGETAFKLITASIFYRLLAKLADVKIPRNTGDFRLINRRVLVAYNNLSEAQRFTRGLIAWLGFQQIALAYDREARFAGTTKYPLRKMINFSLDAMTGFSLKPLRLIIYLGIMTAFVSMGAFTYSIYQWMNSATVPGWASIITAVCILSSVQLICIGVVGEYVGRTFIEAKNRPLFLLQDTTEDGTVTDKKNLINHLPNETEFPILYS